MQISVSATGFGNSSFIHNIDRRSFEQLAYGWAAHHLVSVVAGPLERALDGQGGGTSGAGWTC